MKCKILFICAVLLSTMLFAKYSDIRVVPVSRTPESNTIILKIVFPRNHAEKSKLPIPAQMRLEGFPLGVISQFDRAKELRENPKAQSVRVIVDEGPYKDYNQSREDSFDENREFYDKIVSFDIKDPIQPGQHIIRTFPVRSFGESLKDPGAYDAEVFYYQDPSKKNTLNQDLSKPYLTYNEPQGHFSASNSNTPILLDFYLTNCQLSSDGFKIRLSIDGHVNRMLTDWVPYYIYGLPKGSHTIMIELLDKDSNLVPGIFNKVSKTIIVH